MNKIIQNNLRGANVMNEDSGFIVTDGHSTSYGKFYFVNKTMKKWL